MDALLSLLLQEVPLYVPYPLQDTITNEIKKEFTSPAFTADPYASEIFKLTDNIPFPTIDINLKRTENVFPDFLREVVNYYSLGNNYNPELINLTLNGKPFPIYISNFKLDPTLPLVSLLYKSIIGVIFKEINILTYRLSLSEKAPTRLPPSERVEYFASQVPTSLDIFEWRKMMMNLFQKWVLNGQDLKNNVTNQGLLILSKALPIYVSISTNKLSIPPKFYYISPDLWLKLQERSNEDYGNQRFTLYELLIHPVTTLEEAETELGMFPLSSELKGKAEGRKFSSDEQTRRAGLLKESCDRYSYYDLIRMTSIALDRQPDSVLKQHLVTPGVYNRKEVLNSMHKNMPYYNKYLLCQLLQEFSFFSSSSSKEEKNTLTDAINVIYPLRTTDIDQLYYKLIPKRITQQTINDIRLDVRKSAPAIAKLLTRAKFGPPTVGVTTNPYEILPLRNVRLVLGLKDAYEILCYDTFKGEKTLTRLMVGKGDILLVVPSPTPNQRMSIYPLTNDPEALFVV